MTRRLVRLVAAAALAAAAVVPMFAGSAAAETGAAPQSCRLIQTWLNYSALNYGWAQGLEGCAGNVTNVWEIGPTQNGPWTAQDPYDIYYNDEYGSYWVYEGDLCFAWHRLTASYGSQSITTNAVRGVGSEPC